LPRGARWEHDALVEIRDTRYARAPDGAYIAYQATGAGPVDMVFQFDYFSNVDLLWETPTGSTLRELAKFLRLILHDRRATGLSSRNVAVPNLETRVSDLQCVLDAAGSERPVLCGMREAGAPNALLAASDPDRVRSLIWYGPSAKERWSPDYPWGASPEYAEMDERALDYWGTDEWARSFLEAEGSVGHAIPEDQARTLALMSRQTTTPDVARDLTHLWYETDVREVLRSVRVPTLLITHEDPDDLEEARYIAELMPQATLVTVPGTELLGELDAIVDPIREFVGPDRPVDRDSVLATILFTDIVGSTERQSAAGDHAWKVLIERHHALVREMLAHYRGVEIDTSGDGFFATFDGPARAIRCAQELIKRLRDRGLEIRAGIHTGECELINDKVGGIAVTVGARISAIASPSEILISQTVKDLVAGSGLKFEDAGEHRLKGIPDLWRLYRVVT
jgi:class 3 adenylate cyclase/pimeloyl-ACP methyl ester carboxylesterase